MAKGENAAKPGMYGAEYWSRRPGNPQSISHRPGTNKKTKRITHKMERARQRELVRKERVDG